MKRPILAFVFAISVASQASAGIRILACEPEWASLAKELAGEKATVHSATTALQDVHKISARPSLISKMRRADLLICTGADLEAAWLSLLIRKSGNPRVLPGQPGFIEAANHVTMQEIPASIDRSHGDVHPHGNPHIQTDPRNIAKVANVVARRLVQIDPGNGEYYASRLEDFQRRWEAALVRWQSQAKKLKGMPIVSQHKSWIYLINWLGLERVAVLENKPGLPPSAAHLSEVAQQLEQRPAKVIIRAAYQSPRAADWLVERTRIPAVALPFTVGGNDKAVDLFSLFDETLRILGQYAE